MICSKGSTGTASGRRERDSNFEVLRIVAMLMIILHHIALYGGWPPGLDQTFDLTPDSFFIQFIYHFGKIGVWIFVLITGYFMVSSKGPVVPKLIRLWLQVFTTSVIFNVVFILFGGVPADSIDWASQLLPVLSGTWWFASVFLIFLPFVPFVNRLLNALDRREHLTLVALMLILWFVVPSFTHSGMYGSLVIMFLAMYALGAYIGLHQESFERSAGRYGALTLVSIAVLALLIAAINLVGPVEGLRPFESTMVWGEDRSIMVVVIATLTFLTFRRLDLGRIRWVNVVASTTFGVYLIQEHTQMRHWIFQSLDMGSHYGSPDLVPYVLACMLAIFALCSALEFVRMQTVERATSRLVPPMTRAVYRMQSLLVGDRHEPPEEPGQRPF